MYLSSSFLRRALLCLSAGLLVACSDGCSSRSGSSDDNGDNGDRVDGRLMGELTLLGTAAADYPLTWHRLCAQDIAEGELDPLCTSTDDVGDYRVQGLFHRRGLVDTSFTDRFGVDQTWYSLYDLGAVNTAARTNLNATADLMTRAYLGQSAGQTPEECYISPGCIQTLGDQGLDDDLLNRIRDNVGTLLGPLWPNGARPITGAYQADPSVEDDLAQMHRRLRYTYETVAEGLQVEVRTFNDGLGCDGTILTTALVSDLAQDSLPDDVTTLDEDDLTAASQCASSGNIPAPDFVLEMEADPDFGEAPLDVDLLLSTTASGDITYEGQLMNPRGQTMRQWTGQEQSATLEAPGEYLATGRATRNGEEARAGTSIIVEGDFDDLSMATWGLTGSCRPAEQQIGNMENKCLEKMDGTVEQPPLDAPNCSALAERPELIYNPGVCSQIEQYGGELLGICTKPDSETRLLYYARDSLAESTQQQHNRLSDRCDTEGGDWDSQL
ncbi:MAG: hypothetical protein LAT62_09790 [Natronospirillum sp.]|uniref:hypothetical protein n=1 Tax=Natronospirillum sp. TaxID=2812955 RepID=UPI0025E1C1AA|nr:hypothetical protein [Natronospirillum sp.]MCH8552216.1 hypothetical protein [Natronospirillum sp.]